VRIYKGGSVMKKALIILPILCLTSCSESPSGDLGTEHESSISIKYLEREYAVEDLNQHLKIGVGIDAVIMYLGKATNQSELADGRIRLTYKYSSEILPDKERGLVGPPKMHVDGISVYIELGKVVQWKYTYSNRNILKTVSSPIKPELTIQLPDIDLGIANSEAIMVDFLEKIRIMNFDQELNDNDVRPLLKVIESFSNALSSRPGYRTKILKRCDLIQLLSQHIDEVNVLISADDGVEIELTDIYKSIYPYLWRGKKLNYRNK